MSTKNFFEHPGKEKKIIRMKSAEIVKKGLIAWLFFKIRIESSAKIWNLILIIYSSASHPKRKESEKSINEWDHVCVEIKISCMISKNFMRSKIKKTYLCDRMKFFEKRAVSETDPDRHFRPNVIWRTKLSKN